MSTIEVKPITKPSTRPLPLRLDGLIASTKSLLHALHHQAANEQHYEQLKESLSGLPMTVAEYALATRRLVNAHEYASNGEAGAAQYEVTILAHAVVATMLRRYG